MGTLTGEWGLGEGGMESRTLQLSKYYWHVWNNTLVSGDFISALVILNTRLSSLVDSAQYLQKRGSSNTYCSSCSGNGFLPLTKESWDSQEAQQDSVIRKQDLPLDCHYPENTGTKNEKKVREEKRSHTTTWMKAFYNWLKLCFKKHQSYLLFICHSNFFQTLGNGTMLWDLFLNHASAAEKECLGLSWAM